MNNIYKFNLRPASRMNSNITPTKSQTDFNQVLGKAFEKSNKLDVKFSKHASTRLDERNIILSNNELKRLNEGIQKASNKGVKDALILMDNKVFVANIKNKTIITASTDEQLKDNIFTNIDGAVIV